MGEVQAVGELVRPFSACDELCALFFSLGPQGPFRLLQISLPVTRNCSPPPVPAVSSAVRDLLVYCFGSA